MLSAMTKKLSVLKDLLLRISFAIADTLDSLLQSREHNNTPDYKGPASQRTDSRSIETVFLKKSK